MANAVTPVILGLLSLGPRSGYEIKAAVDRSTRFFWAASYGQIYPELRRLEGEGLVEGEDAPNGGRARRVYRLTSAGRDGARRAGCTGRATSRSSCATRRCCGSSSPTRCRASTRCGCSRGGGAATRQYLEVLRAIDARPGEDPPFVDLVLRWGIAFNEWGAQWCTEQLNGWARDDREPDRADVPSIVARGLPGFLREGFLPLGAFYAG